ncbi:polysaccharide pyruvyl transferase family protein [Phragmitibacter flavus]|uniref:Polysaccharide pyruvyl transferase family protein n=1 Tax=Phragmitibacter flavus TaxID=2576071 RepID=A0A5R8K8U8_9BACT|nr:polysaccharide pyruvyl transferase family protein [Phragmitibacter flavus]TLD68738.1 polysaccharide pyruvyl transferase family protein [Phragmitibacter flavus]
MMRRHFLTSALASIPAIAAAQAEGRKPRIVLRSSWQTVNIGDIGHTPGVLAILEKHLPNVEVILWPSDVSNGVEPMLLKRFPNLVITKDRRIIDTCDFLLHGSGPYLTAHRDVAIWKNEVKKPYGIFGITMAPAGDPGLKIMSNNGLDDYTKDLLDTASFVFLRDPKSLQVVKDANVKSPIIEFGPDGAFATDLRNDETALSYLQANKLEEGKFLCVIPNLRNAPYWRIKRGTKFHPEKHRRNEEMKEHDHVLLREAIIAILRETDHKILICPEDSTQMQEGKELLFDPLPDELKPRVVWRDKFWLTDEALSIYVRSAGLFGSEMHSPIMCIGNGIPAIVCRFVEQTTKGFMWEQIGLGDWLFDLDNQENRTRLVPTILAMAKDPNTAQAKANKARQYIQTRQAEQCAILKRLL